MNKSDIAIIGMSCRFPSSPNVDTFWDHIKNGSDLITTLSTETLEKAGIPKATLMQPNYVKRTGIVEDIEQFDAEFFNLTPLEATAMDPQQRLFMECCWEALEHAAYNPFNYPGLVGIFAGSGSSQYFSELLRTKHDIVNKLGLFHLFQLHGQDFIATRTAYKLNLKGPAVTIQTACSTSLVAVHYACQSLLTGDCDIALAGGASLSIPPHQGYLYRKDMILSSDGYNRAFDARANGTVGSSGVGIVVLKLLEEALADGDFIHAVIKGTAINNDGSQKVGFTAPSVEGQRAVIQAALGAAGVHAREISYVEAHGTGTTLGDPIEVAALTQAFQQDTSDKQFCALGSVKTNLGHTDAAAGCAGLIKTVLSLQHKQIPPSLHYQTPNPQISFDSSPFYVNTQLVDWHTSGPLRKAGVSSFGVGGTNAHVIVEEAPQRSEKIVNNPAYLIILSAKSAIALSQSIARLQSYLDQTAAPLAHIAYTLQVGRHAFAHRFAVICSDKTELLTKLSSADNHEDLFKSTVNIECKDETMLAIEKVINPLLSQQAPLLAKQGYNLVYEHLVKALQQFKGTRIRYPSPGERHPLLHLLAHLWLQGVHIEWALLYGKDAYQRVPLPTYPFQKKRYWAFNDSLQESDQLLVKTSESRANEAHQQHSQERSLTSLLCHIWQDHLKLESITRDDNFFDLGGDSLLAVSLIDRINEQLHCQLTVDGLIGAPTVGKLAEKIANLNSKSSASGHPFCLVTLQEGDATKQPLFLIHPVGGTVYYYQELVSTLDPSQPVYGIQAQSLDGKSSPMMSIEDMALHYTNLVLSVQAEGPYFLGGSSFGGIVAYEMARQLAQSNKQIGLLSLIDAPGPGYMPAPLDGTAEIIHYLMDMSGNKQVSLKKLKSMPEDEQISWLLRHIELPTGFNIKLFLDIFKANMNAMYQYRPQPYEGKGVFFAAQESNPYMPENLEQAWKPLCQGGLDVIQVAGNHMTMNQTPYINKVGSFTQLCIDTVHGVS